MASCPKKTNLANGVSMDLELSNCEISKMEETNRSVRFDPIESLPRAPASGSCRRRVENSEVDCWISATTRRHKFDYPLWSRFMHVQILCIDSAVDLFAILSPAGRPAASRPAGQEIKRNRM